MNFKINKIIFIKGWLINLRFHSNFVFFDLKNFSFDFQIILKSSKLTKYLKIGDFIELIGITLIRKSKKYFIEGGLLEIFCLKFKILNFYFSSIFKNLKFYFLNFFFINNFLIKNYIFNYINFFFFIENFIYVETPILNKYINEGSHLYVVPLIFKKNFFSLSQSPQIFKQLLMIFGLNSYYQFSKCFRNEDLKSNRLFEFIQLDFELSFYKNLDIIFFIKKIFFYLIYKIFFKKNFYQFCFLFYKDCLIYFLNDKPDLRLKIIFINFKFINFYFLNFYKNFYLKICFNYLFFINNFKNYLFFLRNFNFKFFIYFFNNFYYFNFFFLLKHYFIIFFEVFSYLNFLKNFLIYFNYNINPKDEFKFFNFLENNFLNFKFLFLLIINFPLFNYDLKFKKFFFSGNPFSKPINFDLIYLDLNPILCFSKSYDIILNGQEIGGGSVRNEYFFFQKKIFLISFNYFELLYNFNFFLNFLKKSAPVHSGSAIGFDRFLMCFLGLNNIRDVSIFNFINFKDNIFKTSNFIL